MATIKEDFVKFLKQGNLVAMSIAFVIGAAFAAVVTALVADVITPLIGAAFKFDFSTWQFTLNGSVFHQGLFLNALITFVIVALVVFFLIALPYQRYQDRQEAKKPVATPTSRPCPECLSQIPLGAKRCSSCASVVVPISP
jgi:large conductance mechanosensitive channel